MSKQTLIYTFLSRFRLINDNEIYTQLRADGEAGITPSSQGGDRKIATESPEFKSRSVHHLSAYNRDSW